MLFRRGTILEIILYVNPKSHIENRFIFDELTKTV
jgi:hypothetical protein